MRGGEKLGVVEGEELVVSASQPKAGPFEESGGGVDAETREIVEGSVKALFGGGDAAPEVHIKQDTSWREPSEEVLNVYLHFAQGKTPKMTKDIAMLSHYSSPHSPQSRSGSYGPCLVS